MRVLAIYRAEIFSPNSKEKDTAILEAVSEVLRSEGHKVKGVREDDFLGSEDVDLILSMGRRIKTLNTLKKKQSEGLIVINSPESVLASARSKVDHLMRLNGIPAAPKDGNDGYWLKRGDASAQESCDVVFAKNEKEKKDFLDDFLKRGVNDVLITSHVKGDCIKFYGVNSPENFFRYFYPNDFGDTKFGNEKINGATKHYEFLVDDLKKDVAKLAQLTGLEVYGGDCIVRGDGSYAIIDFNDWPSFSRCKDEAARAIATLVNNQKRSLLRK